MFIAFLWPIAAVDGAGLAAKTTVNVTVVDLNDHKPTFDSTSYNFEVLEGNYTQQRVKLGVIQARDEGTKITFAHLFHLTYFLYVLFRLVSSTPPHHAYTPHIQTSVGMV